MVGSVQTALDLNAVSGDARQVAFPLPVTTGDAVLVCVFWKTNFTISSIIDDQGNTYADCGAGRLARPTDGYLQVLGAKNVTGGALLLTITFSGSASDIAIMAVQVLGAHATTLFGQTATGTATSGTTLTTGTFTPTYSSGAILAFGAWNDATTGTPGNIGGILGLRTSTPVNAGLCIEELAYNSALGSNITASLNTGSAGITKGAIIAFEIQAATQVYASTQVLTRTGAGQFAINGQPTFALGKSYFDALDWWYSDLAAMQAARFTHPRILLDKEWDDGGTGTESVFNADGTVRPERLARIHALIQTCDRLGMVCEVVIHVADGTPNSASWMTTSAHRLAAVTNAIAALKGHVNLVWDLINEFNYGVAYDQWNSTEAQGCIDAAFAEDADGLFCCSGGSSVLGLTWGLSQADNSVVTADVDAYLASGLDIFAVHEPREVDFYDREDDRASNLAAYIHGTKARPDVAIYFNEPARVDSIFPPSTNPTAAQLTLSAMNAKAAGAAGYVYHSDASYDLKLQPMLPQFTTDELTAFYAMGQAVRPEAFVTRLVRAA